MPTRTATAVWEGRLRDGRGNFNVESGAIAGDYSFGSRFGHGGGSNPEELLAAASAACYSMALSGALEKAGMTPERIETRAACTIDALDGGGWRITRMRLAVHARVPNGDRDAFKDCAEATAQECPVSKALMGNVDIEVDARLED
jgi:osmotically inducible protein OsmC